MILGSFSLRREECWEDFRRSGEKILPETQGVVPGKEHCPFSYPQKHPIIKSPQMPQMGPSQFISPIADSALSPRGECMGDPISTLTLLHFQDFSPPTLPQCFDTLPPPLLSPGSPLRAVHSVPRFHTTQFSGVYLLCSPPQAFGGLNNA